MVLYIFRQCPSQAKQDFHPYFIFKKFHSKVKVAQICSSVSKVAQISVIHVLVETTAYHNLNIKNFSLRNIMNWSTGKMCALRSRAVRKPNSSVTVQARIDFHPWPVRVRCSHYYTVYFQTELCSVIGYGVFVRVWFDRGEGQFELKRYTVKTVIYDVTCLEYGSRTVDVTSVVCKVAQIFVTVDQSWDFPI